MEKIDKNNYKRFLDRYSDFHDGYIIQVDYDTEISEVRIMFDVWALGKPTIKENYNQKQTKLKMVFKDIDNFSENNPYDIDYIDYTYIDFYKKNEKSLICFSINDEDPDKEPYIFITCESIEYEEIK